MSEPIKLTPGEYALLMQAKMIGQARGWKIEKVIAKLRKVADVIEVAVKAATSQPAPEPTPDVKGQQAIDTAEAMLKEVVSGLDCTKPITTEPTAPEPPAAGEEEPKS